MTFKSNSTRRSNGRKAFTFFSEYRKCAIIPGPFKHTGI